MVYFFVVNVGPNLVREFKDISTTIITTVGVMRIGIEPLRV